MKKIKAIYLKDPPIIDMVNKLAAIQKRKPTDALRLHLTYSLRSKLSRMKKRKEK